MIAWIAAFTRKATHGVTPGRIARARQEAVAEKRTVGLRPSARIDLDERSAGSDWQPQAVRCVVKAGERASGLPVERQFLSIAGNLPGKCGRGGKHGGSKCAES